MAGSPNFPGWANELAEKYCAGTLVEFLVHGAVHDLVRTTSKKNGEREYASLKTFLETQLFERRDAVISYDVSRGITFRDEKTLSDFDRAVKGVDAASGTQYAQKLPRDPRNALTLIERYIRSRVDPRGD